MYMYINMYFDIYFQVQIQQNKFQKKYVYFLYLKIRNENAMIWIIFYKKTLPIQNSYFDSKPLF